MNAWQVIAIFLCGVATVVLAPYIFRFLFREGYAFLFLVGNGGPLPYMRYLRDKIFRRGMMR